MGDEKFASKEHQNGVEQVDGGLKSADEESEPCLKEKSKGRVFWANTERKLREKSGLTKRGLYIVGGIVLAALLLLIVVIILASLWPTTSHAHRFPVCKSDACLRISTQIRQYMNESVSQCEDTLNWACGGWLRTNSLPPERSKWNRRVKIEVQETVRLRELISTLKLPLSLGTVEWKLKHFYESCTEVDSVNADGARPLNTIINKLGGWYLLRNWNLEEFDFNKLVTRLHVEFGVSPYFKITTVPKPREPGNSTIMILPSGLGLPDKSYYFMADEKYGKAYEQLITDIIVILTQTKTDAIKFGRDIFSYEKRLAEIMPNSADLLSPIATDNPVKVSELKISTQQILPLQDILAAMYPDARITEETEVLVAHPEYLTKLSFLVSSTPSSMKNSYLIWTLVREYIPYLSSQFQNAVDLYRSEVYGVKKPTERWEFCARLMHRFMSVGIDALLQKQESSTQSDQIVNEMFASIRKNVKKHLEKYKTYTDLHSKLEKKVDSVKLQIGLPDNVLNASYIKNYYNNFNIIKSVFFENYKHAVLFMKNLEERQLIEGSVQDYVINAAAKRPASVAYIPSSNTIVVPRALLTSPYFEPGYSKSVNYARLGHDIAFALASSVLPYDSAWSADFKLLTPFHLSVNESLRLVRYPTYCLAEHVNKQLYVSRDFSNLTALNTFKYLSALNIAHDSLKMSLDGNPHIHLPTLENYEDANIFYLTNMQELCSISTAQQDLHDTLVDFQLPEKFMFNVILKQTPNVGKTLECDGFSNGEECSDIF